MMPWREGRSRQSLMGAHGDETPSEAITEARDGQAGKPEVPTCFEGDYRGLAVSPGKKAPMLGVQMVEQIPRVASPVDAWEIPVRQCRHGTHQGRR